MEAPPLDSDDSRGGRKGRGGAGSVFNPNRTGRDIKQPKCEADAAFYYFYHHIIIFNITSRTKCVHVVT